MLEGKIEAEGHVDKGIMNKEKVTEMLKNKLRCFIIK